MIAYEKIYEFAAENYGLISSKDAARLGISNMALVMLEKRGRLLRVGRGVYRLEQFPASEYDPYANLVAKAGEGAFLWGPTVLAIDHLCPTDLRTMYVGVPGRVRRALGKGAVIKSGVQNTRPSMPHGIPAQSIPEAIRSSRGLIMISRLHEAMERAKELGLILQDEYEALKKELGDGE